MRLLNLQSHIGSSTAASFAASFDLDISGVAGFFGGDATLAAMNTVHIYSGRRWMGWYNQPGTYEVAKKYGQLARSPFWDALYPGPNLDPATLFEFDRVEKATKYAYAHWGADDRHTSYVARLFLEECRDMNAGGGPSTPMGSVTMVQLPNDLGDIDLPVTVARLPQSPAMILAALMTMLASLAAAVGCAVLRDWPCFAMILLGMFTNGVAHFVLSGRDLVFGTPETVEDPDAPRAGVLHGRNDLVVLTGPKVALRAITKGHYTLIYANESHYHNIGICSAVLSLQFLAQLLVVPQGELYGQLLFLGSLAASWAYNSYISSSGLEILLRQLFLEKVLEIGNLPRKETRSDPEKDESDGRPQVANIMEQYWLARHPARAALAVLLLVPFVENAGVIAQVLEDLTPLKTEMWRLWKDELIMRNVVLNFDTLRDPELVLSKGVKFEYPLTPIGVSSTPYIKLIQDVESALIELRKRYRK